MSQNLSSAAVVIGALRVKIAVKGEGVGKGQTLPLPNNVSPLPYSRPHGLPVGN